MSAQVVLFLAVRFVEYLKQEPQKAWGSCAFEWVIAAQRELALMPWPRDGIMTQGPVAVPFKRSPI